MKIVFFENLTSRGSAPRSGGNHDVRYDCRVSDSAPNYKCAFQKEEEKKMEKNHISRAGAPAKMCII